MPLDNDYIQENIRKLRKILKKNPKRPPPELIHKLRTQSRRFEAIDEALGLGYKPKDRKALKRLKSIRKKAGRVRDMDVLTGHLCTVHEDVEQDSLVQLFEHLGTERYSQAARLRRLSQKFALAIRKRLKMCSKRVNKIVGRDAKGAPAEAGELALRLSNELAIPAVLNRTNLHPYRLKVKELRYILQLSQDSRHEEFVNALGQCKDAIGEWHDWEQLIVTAADLLDQRASSKRMAALRRISGQKYRFALSTTEKMRRTYASTADRSKRSSSRTNIPPQPALKAIAKVAA